MSSVPSAVKSHVVKSAVCSRLRRLGLPALFASVLVAFFPGLGRLPAAGNGAHIVFSDDFEQPRLDRWQMPFPEDWAILSEGSNHYLHMKRNRDPAVPRRPVQFALIKNARVGSFDFQARVRRQGGSMIVVFNYVDPLHFYYAHLSKDAGHREPVHNGIFLVNDAPRVRIAGLDASAALPDTSWHRIRVLRDAATGRISVWSNVQRAPLFTVTDRTFTCGEIGIGSFDETGDFDDVELRSDDAGCAAQPKAALAGARPRVLAVN